MSQSTPVRGDRISIARLMVIACFNPRPRMEGDRSDALIVDHGLVSIHAPRAGGDFQEREDFRLARVSIHAPARGATGDGEVLL